MTKLVKGLPAVWSDTTLCVCGDPRNLHLNDDCTVACAVKGCHCNGFKNKFEGVDIDS